VIRTVRRVSWLSAVVLAGLQAWAYRYTATPDGLSYLDLADAFLRGDWDTAINPYWGPLYPALLAVGLSVVRPSAESVLPLVKAVNFGIFLCSLTLFNGFLRELLQARTRKSIGGPPAPALSDVAITVFAYGAFVYATLGVIGVHWVTPDLCVAAACFGIAGLVLRLCYRGPSWNTAVLLGITLGIAYLAKSVMFVLGIILLFSLPLAPALRPAIVRFIGPAAAAFLAVASLLIIPISRETGELTFGTAGTLTYGFMVNLVPPTNWQGESTATSQPLRPPRRLAAEPPIFEYTAHLKGTYPPWFDPTYWSAGLQMELHPWNQARRILRSGETYMNLFFGGGVAATLLVALVWLCAGGVSVTPELRTSLPLVIFGLAGLLIYVPINVEMRFAGAFAALCWILPPALARIGNSEPRQLWLDRAALACAACLVISVAAYVEVEAVGRRRQRDPHPRVAASLTRLGVRPGDRVVSIGIASTDDRGSFGAFWARLAGVQIVADMPAGSDFVCAPQSETRTIYAEFARLGARALVTAVMPSRWCASGWQRVEGTDYHVRSLEGGPK
jgi:hypothetical protein